MARKKKTLVGAVAGSVTDAVSSAIDALAHPMETVGLAKRILCAVATVCDLVCR